ncbi:MAG: hypothetical protein IKD35_04615, partial [Clostridia bacterium]|nr:hypothetical protein [Clostridia bacterium]
TPYLLNAIQALYQVSYTPKRYDLYVFLLLVCWMFIALSSALPVVGKHSPLWLKTIRRIVF